MAKMTDPTDAPKSFQEALLGGQVQLQPGALEPDLFVHLDHPNGKARFTYATLQGRTVTALVILVVSDPIDGAPCFQIGYAVPEAYRQQGRAKQAVRAAIAELEYGLTRNRIATFYVEAIVGADNMASQKVAEETLSTNPVAVTDEVSGVPAFQYVRKIG